MIKYAPHHDFVYVNRVIWQNEIQVWLVREPTILKTAATLQKSIEIKVKLVISIPAAVQLFKSMDIQDSKIYTAFLDWCIEVQDRVFHPDVQMIDFISVCSHYLYAYFIMYPMLSWVYRASNRMLANYIYIRNT